MQVESRKVITIDYTLTDESGEVLDTSKDDGPLSYLHGSGNVIPGLEAALEGRTAGDSLQVKVAPEDAYGERDEALVQALPRDQFPDGDLEVGMRFRAQAGASTRVLTVVAVDDKDVTIDANHPLAGRTLSFDVTVRDVREATEEELEHGHVHDGDGHHHHHDGDEDDEDDEDIATENRSG
ncbi:MAG TPA: peptidylprolyl isomerase [Polyangiaceae bacterium]|nr:peptidylprolyl isomerase [Polyangiaceae bacterium]